MEKEQRLWLNIAIIIAILLLLTSGFTLGYLYSNNGCQENPFIFGVKILNEVTNDSNICSCISSKGILRWNDEGLINEDELYFENNPLEIQIP